MLAAFLNTVLSNPLLISGKPGALIADFLQWPEPLAQLVSEYADSCAQSLSPQPASAIYENGEGDLLDGIADSSGRLRTGLEDLHKALKSYVSYQEEAALAMFRIAKCTYILAEDPQNYSLKASLMSFHEGANSLAACGQRLAQENADLALLGSLEVFRDLSESVCEQLRSREKLGSLIEKTGKTLAEVSSAEHRLDASSPKRATLTSQMDSLKQKLDEKRDEYESITKTIAGEVERMHRAKDQELHLHIDSFCRANMEGALALRDEWARMSESVSQHRVNSAAMLSSMTALDEGAAGLALAPDDSELGRARQASDEAAAMARARQVSDEAAAAAIAEEERSRRLMMDD